MEGLAVERVGQKIVDWYSCIKTNDVKQAKLLKPEVDVLVANMNPDDKMLAYYQLVSLQYDLLILKVSPEEAKTKLDVNVLEGIANQADDYLKFMYYYVCGRAEFYHKRYKSAIRTYKIAERLIEEVKDPVEKAEFYQKLGISYYQIDQYTFAYTYLELALEFFEKNSSYKINVFMCKQILASIFNELHQQAKAQEMYDDLLTVTKPFPYDQAVTNYNIGINRIWRGNFKEAIAYFKQALENPEFQKSAIFIKAHYHIINLEIRLGEKPKGLAWLEEEAKLKNAKDIEGKLMVTRGLYVDEENSLIMQGLELLESSQCFYEAYEMSSEVSKYYKRSRDLKRTAYFTKYAHDMKCKAILGLDQS
ncbi:response regulator aspartate phosphatase [Shouchella lehensis]|uniref:Methylase n=1 Tax=Shouchella lehensis G1 TaxID=1246626 RepID=A0A060M7R1_9BACI|nr:hypothetical protein [Shouchella lehensis]AIC96104.1 methylase [Shouchella lehensis G1]